MWSDLSHWFWDEKFWLPTNRTWKDLKRNETVFYPDVYDLLIPFPVALGLFFVRICFERFVAVPFGRYIGIKETLPRRAVPNAVLEKAFLKHRHIIPSHDVITGLAKQVDWTTRQVERWWRRRRVLGKASEMKRFTETSWRFLFYIVAFWLGLYVLWDKPWLWDTKHCWYGYPLQHVPGDVWWYYMLELSFYWSLVFSLFMDIKRKDFRAMIVHHVATIGLMVMSWSGNMIRVGTLVLGVHDAVDYLLEGAKLAHYCRCPNLCNVLFVVFTIVWFLSRILFFPLRILNSTLFEGHIIIGFANIYYWYNGLLIILQVLHIIWFYMILRMVYGFVVKGHVEKDERSETEPETNSDDDKVSFEPSNVAAVRNNNVKFRHQRQQNHHQSAEEHK